MQPRRPAFAGSWYPEDDVACREQIEAFIAEDFDVPDLPAAPRAGIVPHAGWFFSGAIACQVIQALGRAAAADVVVIFGMHMHPGQQPVIMDRGSWDTPLGPLPVAEELAGRLTERFAFTIETPRVPNRDNTIELQLPFIRYFFGEKAILPIGVPPSRTALDIARAVVEEARAQGLKLQIIGSTDLTHYGPNYGFMGHGRGRAAAAWVREENDRRFIETALRMKPEDVIAEGLGQQNACCAGAAAAAIQAGMALGASQGTLMVQTTSYEKSPGDSVVGYAGLVFC